MRRKLIVGNWKMNGDKASLSELDAIDTASRKQPDVDVGLALPATLIAGAVDRELALAIGAQDVHSADAGAHTGCISAAMVAESGAAFTLVGHSERRSGQFETGEQIKHKAETAHRHRLSVVVCVGETASERAAGEAEYVVAQQLSASLPENAASEWLAIAYEPVWAIGADRTPSKPEIESMHRHIRQVLERLAGTEGQAIRILYGGSVNGDNASAIMRYASVDGVLVGGASLKAPEFVRIVEAANDGS